MRIALVLPLLLVGVLFGYNSCQSAFHAMDMSSSASLCAKPVQANQRFAQANLSPLQTKKVWLSSPTTAKMRAQSQGLTGLTALIDVSCVQNRKVKALAETIIGTSQLLGSLERQAFRFSTPLSESVLTAQANDDACIIGISFDHEYKKASVNLNDADYSQQAQLFSMNAAQGYSRFFDSTYGILPEGSGAKNTIVAVVDSGVDYSHPDLNSNILQLNLSGGNVGYGVDAATIGSNLVNYNPIDVDPESHGTHVSGLVAATTGNSIGIVGTAPSRTRILAVRIFDINSSGDTVSSTITAVNGLEFARANNADVVNLSIEQSYAGPSATNPDAAGDAILQDEIQKLVSQGITVVMAMGNATDTIPAGEVDETSLTVVPAIYAKNSPGVIGVASVDTNLVNGLTMLSSFSNYGVNYAKIGSYGAQSSQGSNFVGVLSTLRNGTYGTLAGTSMATPEVSAAVSLVITLIRDRTGHAPSPAEVERLLLLGSKKNTNLASVIKDGNTLDLGLLFDAVARNYPQTVDPAYFATLCP